MGFGAQLRMTIAFDAETRRPFIWKNGEKVFDLTQIPETPDEFDEFSKLSGWEWTAYMPSVMDGDDDEWCLTTELPTYEEVCEDDNMKSADGSPYHSEEDYNKFKRFCEWAVGTGFEYCYTTWA